MEGFLRDVLAGFIGELWDTCVRQISALCKFGRVGVLLPRKYRTVCGMQDPWLQGPNSGCSWDPAWHKQLWRSWKDLCSIRLWLEVEHALGWLCTDRLDPTLPCEVLKFCLFFFFSPSSWAYALHRGRCCPTSLEHLPAWALPALSIPHTGATGLKQPLVKVAGCGVWAGGKGTSGKWKITF